MAIRALVLMTFFLAAVHARADVSDSGNLTIGGTGVIQGTMTVQGSAFSVGGTTFSVAGGSITLGGRLNATAAGIKWADGSTSTTASSGGGVSVVQSTTVYMDTGQSLGTGLWPACFTNSTATLTGVTSSCVMVLASGSWLLDSAGYNYGLALIVNGALVPGTDNSKRSHGQVWETPSGGGYSWPFNIAELVCGLATSTVNVCLTGSAENSATLAGTSGTHTARKPELSIIEVRK